MTNFFTDQIFCRLFFTRTFFLPIRYAVAKTTKIKKACDKLERSFQKQKEIVKDIFKLPDTSQLDTKKIVIEKDIQRKLDGFGRLMLLIKDKLNNSSLIICQKV